MKKFLLVIIFFFNFSNNLYSEEIMILKLKDGDVD